MLLMIDNYDSFTYNLVQYFAQLNESVKVVCNDELSCTEIACLKPQRIVISPGPGTPEDAGISIPLIKTFAGKIPILGVCLGHQCIGQVFGGEVVHAREVMHGKTSLIEHNGAGVFGNLPSTFEVTRYHSLVLKKDSLPDCFEITAWTRLRNGEFDEVMGLRHKHYPLEGVQFHPESILTEHGHALIQNFLENTL